MVWGKPLLDAAVGESGAAEPLTAVSPTRILGALAVVGAATWALESVVGLGPILGVVLVASFGCAAAVRYGHAAGRVAIVTLLVFAASGLGWIELVNKVQYGTLALTGAPPLVRWCGTTYAPSGVVTSDLSTGAGSTYSKILRTPSGYDVFGVALATHHSCGVSGPLFVGVGPSRYAAYDSTSPPPSKPVD